MKVKALRGGGQYGNIFLIVIDSWKQGVGPDKIASGNPFRIFASFAMFVGRSVNQCTFLIEDIAVASGKPAFYNE
ncbi:unnamed protein product, partial [marine sediment metagenome]